MGESSSDLAGFTSCPDLDTNAVSPCLGSLPRELQAARGAYLGLAGPTAFRQMGYSSGRGRWCISIITIRLKMRYEEVMSGEWHWGGPHCEGARVAIACQKRAMKQKYKSVISSVRREVRLPSPAGVL